jgi:isopentenyl-diphosphate delta-isomerase
VPAIPADDAPVVLLDDELQPIGELPKSQAHHTETPLHRGFSCYLFDSSGRVLMTRRAITKKTWPGVWSNTCCGHPLPGEHVTESAARRLADELGLRLTSSEIVLPDFRYRAVAPDGVVENEFCPVLVGKPTANLIPTPPRWSNTAGLPGQPWLASPPPPPGSSPPGPLAKSPCSPHTPPATTPTWRHIGFEANLLPRDGSMSGGSLDENVR